MTGILSEQYLDRDTLNRLNHIAAGIFARHGVDFSTARPAGGWTNATWLADGLALRLSIQPGNDKIRREARLGMLLPPEVGFPTLIDSGVVDGLEWSLAKAVPGRCLGEVWEDLDWDQRADALRQLWRHAEAVHTVSLSAVSGLARERAWFNSCDAEEAAATLARLEAQGLFTGRQMAAIQAGLHRFWQVIPTAPRVLCHGDLTLDNAMWDAGQVTALLDFEYAVTAAPELDLNQVIKVVYAPPHGDEPQPKGPGPERARQAVAELAAPLLSRPGSRDVLLGYSILLELWKLDGGLAHPEGEGPLEGWQCYRILQSLEDGQGGWLAPLFDSIV